MAHPRNTTEPTQEKHGKKMQEPSRPPSLRALRGLEMTLGKVGDPWPLQGEEGEDKSRELASSRCKPRLLSTEPLL